MTSSASSGPLVLRGLRCAGHGPYGLQLTAGECAVVTGPSGSGKSRLLRMVADLDPHEGEAWLGTQSRAQMPAARWRQHVTYLAAEPGWWAETVREHLRDPRRAASMLPWLGLAEDKLDAPVAQLSTGERQRLALARALHADVRFLLLDEPASALDAGNAERLDHALLHLKREGIGMLVVTHNAAQAERLADRRYVLSADGLEASA